MTMNWSDLLTMAIAAGTSVPVYIAARRVYDDIMLRAAEHSMRAMQRKTFEAKLEDFKLRSTVKTLVRLTPDERGRLGAIRRPDGTILNLDTHARFGPGWSVEYMDEFRERLDHMEKLMLAAANLKADTAPLLGAVEPEQLPFEWPKAYEYRQMIKTYIKRPSHHNILLGVRYDDEGHESPVIEDMEDLIHVMIGGRSGFGKSNLEYVIARQLVDSIDDCRLALIDYAGMTLKPLEQSSRVLWPTATNDDEALPVLRGIVQELERRKELFNDCPGVQQLSEYNAFDDREPLVPWYLFLDETSQCLRNKVLAEMLTVISEQARKFGLGIVGAGTTWHATVAPEPFRVNFATRAAVYCSAVTSRVVLDQDSSASELERPGLACVMLPGKTGVSRILTPEVEFEVVDGHGPLLELDAAPQPLSAEEKQARILELHRTGQSNRQIEQAVFGYTGGHATTRVKEAVEAAAMS
jgi:hypothetical protein